MKSGKSIILGILLGVIAAVAAHAASNPQATTERQRSSYQEEFHQTYPLAPGGRIELKNISGAVKISAWDRPEVKVDAVKYAGTREQLADAKIEVEADPDSIRIKTHYNDGNLTFNDDDRTNNPASVDYTLTVPAGARLDSIKLVNGNLDIQNVAGDVLASCINGHLHASGLRGSVALSTINGTLEVAYAAPASKPGSATEPDARLKSVNGRVVLTLPSDSNAEVHARTVSGFIDNSFGLPVDDGRYVGHSLAGRIGSGAAHIELKNVNGSISVQRASDGKPLSSILNILPPKHEREVSF